MNSHEPSNTGLELLWARKGIEFTLKCIQYTAVREWIVRWLSDGSHQQMGKNRTRRARNHLVLFPFLPRWPSFCLYFNSGEESPLEIRHYIKQSIYFFRIICKLKKKVKSVQFHIVLDYSCIRMWWNVNIIRFFPFDKLITSFCFPLT